MPLPLETEPVEPNSVFLPMVMIQTPIIDGQMVPTADVHFETSLVEDAGTPQERWTRLGQTGSYRINSVLALEQDLADLQPLANEIFTKIVQFAAELNARKKIL